MSTSRVLSDPPLTRRLAREGHFAKTPFVLVDVGASGGIAQSWRAFAPHLRAFGFDPLVKEVERLNREERSFAIRYFDGFVGSEGFEDDYPPEQRSDWSSGAYGRSSAVRAQRMLGMSFAVRFNNDDPDLVYSKKRFSLDRFLSEQGVDGVDFVKIDTDGEDYEVLLGARHTLHERGVLGLQVECQLNGPAHPHAGIFANIDRLLREAGFALYDLEVHRYSRAALPGKFVYPLPAQTAQGPVGWAEAVYARDLAQPGYDERWKFSSTPGRLLKALCLYEMFGLPDCAAELALAKRQELAGAIDVDAALDALALQQDPAAGGFAALHQRFEGNPKAFFPAPDGGNPEITRLKGDIEALKSSTSWRITGPLRRLKELFRR